MDFLVTTVHNPADFLALVRSVRVDVTVLGIYVTTVPDALVSKANLRTYCLLLKGRTYKYLGQQFTKNCIAQH